MRKQLLYQNILFVKRFFFLIFLYLICFSALLKAQTLKSDKSIRGNKISSESNLNSLRVDARGEPFAEDILNNVWEWPDAYPRPASTLDTAGFAFNRLGKLPKAGVHPRILFSPEQIPSIRERISNTNVGRALLKNLRLRTSIFDKQSNWESKAYNLLASGDIAKAAELLDSQPKPNGSPGHYQPYFIYELMLKSFDCLIFDNQTEGKKVASAFANYAQMVKPRLEEHLKNTPFPEDVWRAGDKGIMAEQFVAYGYDFAYNFMTPAQRDVMRSLIAKYTFGRITLGMKIPPHFRNWNWIMVGQQLTLNLMAIDGEKGYDKRVYNKCVEVLKDFIDFGISEKGSSREAVGYTGFGFYWGCGAMIGAARRGDNLLIHSHYKAMKYWYIHSLQPYEHRWVSHGDGGDGGPTVDQLAMMKYFYPKDSLIDYLWQNKLFENGPVILQQKINLIVPLIGATDPFKDASGKYVDYKYGKILNLPVTFYDPARGALNTRSEWDKNATCFQMECRIDGEGGSHEHADKGTFTLSALGSAWSLDGFRAVETKYHNGILINGKGQGYFTPSGKWLKTIDTPDATFGVCDTKYSYDWFWPKPFVAYTQPDDPILKSDRYKSFIPEVLKFKQLYGNEQFEKDPSENIRKYWEPFQKGSPRMWDEDPWPVRIKYNPVEKAFRTAGLVRGEHPYILIVDDIQKNNEENLYDWIMMLEKDVKAISMNGNTIILGKDSSQLQKNDFGSVTESRKLKKGDPLLMIKVLECEEPGLVNYTSQPPIRIETFEKAETNQGRGRSYGLDQRLVISSRSVSPNFKILLIPYRNGDKEPEVNFIDGKASIKWNNQLDEINFKGSSGISTFTIKRNGKQILSTEN